MAVKVNKKSNGSSKLIEFLKTFFIGLVSNARCIEGSKTFPWWIGPIIALVSIMIPIIPITVNLMNQNGAAFLVGGTFNCDRYLAETTLAFQNENYSLKINNDSQLLMYKDNAVIQRSLNDNKQTQTEPREDGLWLGSTPIHYYLGTRDGITTVDFLVYYLSSSNQESFNNDLTSLINWVNDNEVYEIGTISRRKSSDVNTYKPSFLILGQYSFYMQINVLNQEKSNSGRGLNYYSTLKNEDLVVSKFLKVETKEKTIANPVFVDECFDNWESLFTEGYITIRNNQTTIYTFTYLGVYAALVLVMGLLLFLITRGKNNPMNYLKFHNTLLMVCWASMSPALLSMIAGFIMPQFAMAYFMILLGLRIMWMSTRQLGAFGASGSQK